MTSFKMTVCIKAWNNFFKISLFCIPIQLMHFDCVNGFLNSIKEIIWQTEAIYRCPLNKLEQDNVKHDPRPFETTLTYHVCRKVINECPWGPHLRIRLRIDRYSRVACFLETGRMLMCRLQLRCYCQSDRLRKCWKLCQFRSPFLPAYSQNYAVLNIVGMIIIINSIRICAGVFLQRYRGTIVSHTAITSHVFFAC